MKTDCEAGLFGSLDKRLRERATLYENAVTKALFIEAADAFEAQAQELQAWKRECGPLLDYLTGSDVLCESPVDYAKELYERIEAQEREIARLRAFLMRICPVDDGFTEHFNDLVAAGLLVEAPSDERYRELWGEYEATMWVWAWSPLATIHK